MGDTPVAEKEGEIKSKLERRLSLRSSEKELKERNIMREPEPEAITRERKRSLRAILVRKLSQRSSVRELKEKKILKFDAYVDVADTYSVTEYDRSCDRPWTRLTTQDKISIKRELNEFKRMEMPVHEESRHRTRFHK